MASNTNEDGSEDVADFLERIREMGDTHAKEDEERTRKLEEEILQGRKERQARRAERARSISPTKDSPLDSSFTAPQQPDSPTPRSKREGNMDRAGVELSPTRAVNTRDVPVVEPTKSNPPAGSPAVQRSGTLSWQQRPDARSSPTIRTRPAPVGKGEDLARSPQDSKETQSPGAQDSSREQVAAMLKGKDPSWFRQTEDRGKQSAAYRKNQDSSAASSGTVRLHGLGSPPASTGTSALQRASSSRSPSPDRNATSPSVQPNVTASPMPVFSSQRFRPPESPAAQDIAGSPPFRSPTGSPSRGRISPERSDRPSSPTKGLGGFVQSAMMKRSDSVNKRSGQATSPTRSVTVSNAKGDVSHIAAGSTRDARILAEPEKQQPTDKAGFQKDTASQPTTSQSSEPQPDTGSKNTQKSPTNVNQSAEAKRWSPSKSSWLEAAINKSDPPKPKVASPAQPSWMAEINKAKQARLGAGGTKDAGADSTSRSESAASSTSAGSRSNPTAKAESASAADLRGSLRSRAPPSQGNQAGEPEFKNVFGKLKKTETKNYVAPDVLKNNITSGKAALNLTGGPRPWVKKDEFKDSILAKKKEMRDGTSVVNTGNIAEAAAAEVPEAISKRGNMSTQDSVDKDAPRPTVPVPKPKPAPPPVMRADTKPVGSNATGVRSKFPERPKPASPPQKPATLDASSKRGATETQSTPSAASTRSSATSGLGRSSVETTPSSPPKGTANRVDPTSPKFTSFTPSKPKRLVDRLNPALAGIIARGAPGAQQESEDAHAPAPISRAAPRKDEKPMPKATTAAALTHTTKSRARGPKRRLPTTTPATVDPTPAATEAERAASPTKPEATSKSSISAGIEKAKTPTRESASASTDHQTPEQVPTPTTIKPTKDAPPPVSKPKTLEIKPIAPAKVPEGSKWSLPTHASAPKTASPKKAVAIPQAEVDKTSDLTKAQSATGRLESPITSPKPRTEFQAPEKATTIPLTKDQPKSPPTPGKKPWGLARVKSEGSEAAAVEPEQIKTESSRPASEASRYLSEAFGQPLSSVAGNEYGADTQAILQRKRPSDKIKTQKKEVCEVTGDGKKIPVPAHREYILFENSMFLCTHAYEAANGKKSTDVYLWVGNEISSSAVEDAQLFCRNSAKEAGGKLVVLNQGKEPPTLFEALGGIVITRKGAPSSAASSRYMLCGRSHLGHVAFDEVDFSPEALFSGFTYIVASADGSKLLLWKGKGSGSDVVGCARLIAMDLGINGDVTEVDEGSEPPSFWTAFGSGIKAPKKAESSVKNASWEKYNTRLFAIDADARPKSSSGFLGWARRTSTPAPEEEGGVVREIHPFAQSDLSPEGIFVVDAFFELLVIVGRDAFSKLSSLHTAVYFAQEYGVLAASLEDRPFIPSSKVIFGGMTENAKHAFRRWDDRKLPTAAKEKIMDLNDVLGAFDDAK